MLSTGQHTLDESTDGGSAMSCAADGVANDMTSKTTGAGMTVTIGGNIIGMDEQRERVRGWTDGEQLLVGNDARIKRDEPGSTTTGSELAV